MRKESSRAPKIGAALLVLVIPARLLAGELATPERADQLADVLGRASIELPGGCRITGSGAEAGRLVIRYACASAPQQRVVRFGPSSAAGTARTKHFTLVSSEPALPADFTEALLARLRDREGGWSWDSPAPSAAASTAPAPTAASSTGAPTPSAGSPPAGDPRLNLANVPAPSTPNANYRAPWILADYERALELYRKGKHREALEIYLALARKHPGGGVLGMVVATLAPTVHDASRVKALAAEADKAPDDVLAQFVAGVAAHYSAHQAAKDREEKKRLYALAIKYLKKVRPAYDFEPRVFIYLAVSHFRLGMQKEAEALIEQGVKLSDTDPDSYYCRAEIFQRVNTRRSLDDLQRYISMTEMHKRQGAVVAPQKEARVRRMYDHLKAVAEGRAKPMEIFDPLETEDTLMKDEPQVGAGSGEASREGPSSEPGPHGPQALAPSSFGLVVLGIGAAALAIVGLVLAIRRRRAPKP